MTFNFVFVEFITNTSIQLGFDSFVICAFYINVVCYMVTYGILISLSLRELT